MHAVQHELFPDSSLCNIEVCRSNCGYRITKECTFGSGVPVFIANDLCCVDKHHAIMNYGSTILTSARAQVINSCSNPHYLILLATKEVFELVVKQFASFHCI